MMTAFVNVALQAAKRSRRPVIELFIFFVADIVFEPTGIILQRADVIGLDEIDDLKVDGVRTGDEHAAFVLDFFLLNAKRCLRQWGRFT